MIAMGATPHIYAASIGIQDSIFLMFLALIVFGPRRLPEIGRQIGKLMYEFRKVSNDFKFQMEEELRAAEEADRQKKLQASLPPPTPPAAPEPSTPPAAETPMAEAPASTAPAESSVAAEPSAEAIEDRGEPRRFPPQIQPPSTGEPVAAARPFRASSPAEPETSAQEAVADSHCEGQPSVSTETQHG